MTTSGSPRVSTRFPTQTARERASKREREREMSFSPSRERERERERERDTDRAREREREQSRGQGATFGPKRHASQQERRKKERERKKHERFFLVCGRRGRARKSERLNPRGLLGYGLGGVFCLGRGYKSSARGTSLTPKRASLTELAKRLGGIGLRAGARHEPTPQASKQERER